MQSDLVRILQKVLIGLAGPHEAGEWQYRPVGGGSITTTYQVSTKDIQQWFCQFNNARKFSRQGLIRVPASVACEQAEDTQVRLAAGNSLLSPAACRQSERLYQRLPDFFPPEPSARLPAAMGDRQFISPARPPQLVWATLFEKYFTHNSTVLIDVTPIFAVPPRPRPIFAILVCIAMRLNRSPGIFPG
jgi:hypothetical protein